MYTYTIGSCLYFKNDENRRASSEESELKSLVLKASAEASTHRKNGKTVLESILEEGDNAKNEWKKKTFNAADCKMKKRIQYHFKDHVKRWMNSDRRRFPWKLILHLMLVILVTTQVVILSYNC